MSRRSYYISVPISHTFEIVDYQSTFTGESIQLNCEFDGTTVSGTWSITSGSNYASINNSGLLTLNQNANNSSIEITATYQNYSDIVTMTVTYQQIQHTLTIVGPDEAFGETIQLGVLYDDMSLPIGAIPNWWLGGELYGSTINPENGLITIGQENPDVYPLEVFCEYNGVQANKNITVQYVSGITSETTTETIIDQQTGETSTSTTTVINNEDGSSTSTTNSTTTDSNGNVISETESNIIHNADGSSSSESTTTNADGSGSYQSTITNTDGSSSQTQSTTSAPDPNTGSQTTISQTTNYDENGDTTGSNTSEITNNTDGSYTSTSTNYDANGDPTDTTNQDRDVEGNIDTQDIEYDSNGNATVTGYTIDTSGNPNGTKDITGDGVNTEFVPFDGSDGFELHIRFYSRKQDQPNPPLVEDTEDKGSNYHFTILCSKDPNAPYPGFHIRWTLSKTNYNSGNIVFGYRGKTGSATNRTLALAPSTGDHANTYDYTISYDPTLKKYPSKFRLEDNLNGAALITLNIDFNPLAYALTLGYNINQQGQPYRYSNVEILEFSINKL